jgi:uncharacterized protein (UPF0276 family)
MGLPDLGVGVGLRVPHYRWVAERHPPVDFFELLSENFMVEGGNPLHYARAVAMHYPVVLHGVSLGIGGPDALNRQYLDKLTRLCRLVEPRWVSDHLCWTGTADHHSHDLLPLPYTRAVARRVAERARQVQDSLGVPFALENTSSYLSFRRSDLTEWQFICEVLEHAEIGLLLDVNNVYVSAYNHGFDAEQYLDNLPHERIVQIHLAGHTQREKYLLDTHNGDVIEPVWDLYRRAIELAGPVPTVIEWDDAIPSFDVLNELAEQARRVRAMSCNVSTT